MNYFLCGDLLEKTSLFVAYNVYYLKLFSHRVKKDESSLLVGQTAPHGYLNAFYGGMKKVRSWKSRRKRAAFVLLPFSEMLMKNTC